MKQRKFTSLLMDWNKNDNKRKMPWKGEKDPYKVWLSEIILQQTRVDQGLDYYNRFVERYPTIFDLAKAQDSEVFKLWEGLGYYTRCKNLLFTARFIVNTYRGNFPSSYEEIKSLKGVGPYTAAAIASFCFNLPYAVVDGNVFRVLSRIYGISTATDTIKGKQQFSKLAFEMLDKNEPGRYNQAIMDFGATVCKPLLPACSVCPMQVICVAYKTAAVNDFPVKEKTLTRKERWFNYFILYAEGRILVHKRSGKDIWQNLHEFFLFESPADMHWDNDGVEKFILEQIGNGKIISIKVDKAQKQQLTHQTIKGYFITVKFEKIPGKLRSEKHQWLYKEETDQLAFPVFIKQYTENMQKQLYLF